VIEIEEQTSIKNQQEEIVVWIVEPETNPWETENSEFKSNYHWKVVHEWRSKDSVVQSIVNYAYKLWWYNFVAVLECENWSYDIKARGDSWHAYWLCQMNDRYHKIPKEYFDSWQVQVEYCFQKRKQWTKFYGPWRIIKWKKCSEYVKSRFTFTE